MNKSNQKWEFDSAKVRKNKTHSTIVVGGVTYPYTHHANGRISFDKSVIQSVDHAHEIFTQIFTDIDPLTFKQGARTGGRRARPEKLGKKKRAIRARAIRAAMGLKEGESALNPEVELI